MSKFNAGKASVLALTAVFAFVLFLFSGQFVMAAPAPVTPSTNAINIGNGWANVTQVSKGIGTTDLQFTSTRAFWSCFEYRRDNEPNTVAGSNPNPGIFDGRWTQVCVNNSPSTKTILANEFVDVRMVYGAETDERFDWTRFNVDPAPDVCDNLVGDQATLPDGMQVDVDNENFCSCKEGYHEVDSEGQIVTADGLNNFTCVADSIPTPTPTASTTSNGGSGVSDGLGCANHDCSGNTVGAPQGQVLGASTLADTGNFAENLYLVIMAIGGIITTVGIKNFKKASK